MDEAEERCGLGLLRETAEKPASSWRAHSEAELAAALPGGGAAGVGEGGLVLDASHQFDDARKRALEGGDPLDLLRLTVAQVAHLQQRFVPMKLCWDVAGTGE